MSTARPYRIAMLSIHTNPLAPLGMPDTGGMSVCIRELARELGRRGHGVDIFTGRTRPGNGETRHLDERVRLIHLDIGPSGQVPKEQLHSRVPRFAEALDDALAQRDTAYHLVHSHYWLSGVVAGKTRALRHLPHVISFHTTALAKRAQCAEEQAPVHRIDAEGGLVRNCDRIVAASVRECQALIKNYKADSGKIGRVPWGVAHNQFRPIDQRAARSRLGLDQTEKLVLFVGRITPVKGLAKLLAAMARLRHYPGLRLLVVGEEREISKGSSKTVGLVVGLVQKLGLSDRVTVAGRIAHEALPHWYSAADCVALPSHDETFGLVALESLACGTPVVATRVGAVETFVQDGRTGILVDDPLPGGLARALEELLTRSQGQRLSPAAIARSVAAHTWSAAAARLLDEYRSVLAHRNEQRQQCRTRQAAHPDSAHPGRVSS